MPIYEYQCEGGHKFTEGRSIEDRHEAGCPVCGGQAQLLISVSNFTMGYATSKPVVDASGRAFRQKIIDPEHDILDPMTSREI